MVKHSEIEDAVQAREELTKRLASLGSVVADSVKTTAQDVLIETVEVAELRVKASLGQIDPRTFIRANPLAALAGAFATGLVLTTRHKSPLKASASPLLAAAAGLGLDLLRAYAMSQIDLRSVRPS